MKMQQRFVTTLSALVLSAGAALAGPADFTVVNEPASNNQTHDKILASMYGGTFNGQNLINGATNMKVGGGQTTTFGAYSNGGITATRVQDRGGTGLFNLMAGISSGADDQQWSDGVTLLQLTNKFASDTHNFGWVDTASGTEHVLFDTSAIGNSTIANLSPDFKWFLDATPSTGNKLTSTELDNPGAGPFKQNFFDQMVAYEITGVDGLKRYVLFWEDRLNGQAFNDYDYNDAVIEVVVVPLPMASIAGGATLLGLAIVRRRFKR